MTERRLRLRIASEADATRALMEVSRMARQMEFTATDAQAISTAVSELVRNILKYAGSGDMEVEEVRKGRRTGLQATVRDRGPGIADIGAAMRDHFSSAGTLGLGLPGVRRMMDDFEIDSGPGRGARVVIRKWREPHRRPGQQDARALLRDTASRLSAVPRGREPGPGMLQGSEGDLEGELECAFFVRPCRGERVSGDMAVVEQRDAFTLLAIIDALGHGPEAHRVAIRAKEFLERSWKPDVTATLQALHGALRGTGGAAAGLCLVDGRDRTARYAGVGNTVIRLFGTRETRLHSVAGTLGHQMRTPREQSLALNPGDVLVMYTDGVKEHFDRAGYREMPSHRPRTIARKIVDRFGKDHDDAGCVVMKWAR